MPLFPPLRCIQAAFQPEAVPLVTLPLGLPNERMGDAGGTVVNLDILAGVAVFAIRLAQAMRAGFAVH